MIQNRELKLADMLESVATSLRSGSTASKLQRLMTKVDGDTTAGWVATEINSLVKAYEKHLGRPYMPSGKSWLTPEKTWRHAQATARLDGTKIVGNQKTEEGWDFTLEDRTVQHYVAHPGPMDLYKPSTRSAPGAAPREAPPPERPPWAPKPFVDPSLVPALGAELPGSETPLGQSLLSLKAELEAKGWTQELVWVREVPTGRSPQGPPSQR